MSTWYRDCSLCKGQRLVLLLDSVSDLRLLFYINCETEKVDHALYNHELCNETLNVRKDS